MEQSDRLKPGLSRMKFFPSLSVVLLVGVAVRAGEPSLSEARSRYLHGNYEEAISLYQVLAASPQYAIPAAIGISRCRQSQGKYDDAEAAIESSLKAHP